MVETTEGNGADQPRRARSSTERSRAHRARKKLEREAALQAEAERVAGAVADVPDNVASVENAVADTDPAPAEQKAERQAGALHEAGPNVRPVQRKRQRSNALQAALQTLQTSLRLRTPFPLSPLLMLPAFLPFPHPWNGAPCGRRPSVPPFHTLPGVRSPRSRPPRPLLRTWLPMACSWSGSSSMSRLRSPTRRSRAGGAPSSWHWRA
jgi:hypothetical protein